MSEQIATTPTSRAWSDWTEAFRNSYVWSHQAVNDLRVRYRRSVIGPWWITIQTAVTIFFLGVVYSQLFKVELRDYLPYLSISIILWFYASSMLSEGCNSLVEAGPLLQRLRIPVPSIFLRVFLRAFLVFLHNAGLIVLVLAIYKLPPWQTVIWALPGFALFVLNLTWMAVILAIAGLRFRDIQQILVAVLSLLLLLTPIFWNVASLPERIAFVEYNPFFHLLQVVRMPLLGELPETYHWTWAIGMAVLGWSLALVVYRATHHRLILWV